MIKKKELSVYVHIPFCKAKCAYCDFASFSSKEDLIPIYFEKLEKEIILRSKDLKDYKISTLFFGGGTPSLVEGQYIKKLVKALKENLDFRESKEISLEVNPGTLTKEKAKIYKEIGINRISLGLQSTNNKLLKEIGRIHSYEEFLKSYEILKENGFNNINIDLMFSLPNQTKEDVIKSIKEVVSLKPTHISLYSLILEEGTPLEKKLRKENWEMDEELDRDMYHSAISLLKENKYFQYEISNFSLKGFKCLHNLNCWDFKEYVGFGSAAHSFINHKRIENSWGIEDYLSSIKENEYNYFNIKKLDIKEEKEDYIMLALRKIKGLNVRDFNEYFNADFLKDYNNQLEKLYDLNLIKKEDGFISLTKKGLDFANYVIEEFF